jgi:integrase
MANLGKKGDLFVARFRFEGKEFKKSLKTTRKADAEAAMHSIERAIHGLATGMFQVPPGIDPGDFILSGGTIKHPARRRRRAATLATLVDEYLEGQGHKAASTAYTEGVHLRNLKNKLGTKADGPADRVAHRDLESYLYARLKERSTSTVDKERTTIVQFFRWAVAHGHLEASPAAGLSPIQGDVEQPPFRTITEIEATLTRGGLSEAEALDLWDCLYLTPTEITGLLRTVRERADADFAFLLHAIPAYSGMRRGELIRLRWSDVEFDPGYMIARSRKQSRRSVETRRRIDLHPELRQELLAWRAKRPSGQFVVCEPDSAEPLDPDLANRCFWQPMRGTTWCLNSKKNWFKIGFHTYRHSFASNLAARGVDQRIVDEWMGHQTEAMRKRYRHLFPEDRRSAIQAFSLSSDPIESDGRPESV